MSLQLERLWQGLLQRFDSQVMLTVIIVLVALVTVLQLCGDRLSRHLNHR